VTSKGRGGRQGPSFTIENLFDGYLHATEAARAKNSNDVILYRLRRVLGVLDGLGVKYLHELRERTLADIAASLEQGELSPHTVRGYAAAFRAAVRWGIRRNLIATDAMGDMVLREAQKGRERHLSKEEIAELLEALDGHVLQLPAALGVYQGLRREEVCNLRVEDVEVRENRLTVTASKNKDWRTIQLHPALLKYLPDPLPKREWLCLNARGSPWTGSWLAHHLRKVLDALGPKWSDVSFHTSRHTCASQMAESGKYTLYAISKFLGHGNPQTTQKYAHLLPEQVRPDW